MDETLAMMAKKMKRCALCDHVQIVLNDGIFSIFCSCGRGSHSADPELAVSLWNNQARRRMVAQRSRQALDLHMAVREVMHRRKNGDVLLS
jgi:hypothetical protein